jgi:hypothetical protein
VPGLPNSSPSVSWQCSIAAGSKQPQPKSSAFPPAQTPQLSVSFVAHSGSISSLFKTQLRGKSSKQ